jgi:hypothetical protein
MQEVGWEEDLSTSGYLNWLVTAAKGTDLKNINDHG